VLLASMFALKWYGLSAKLVPTASALGWPTAADAWHTLTIVRWLLLVTVLSCFALVYLQATRRAPAMPVTVGVITTVLGLITTLVLLYRVVINQPGPNSLIDQKPGAFVGLATAAIITYGGYVSLREEGVPERDGPGEIPTVDLQSAGGS
jgi:hypothetical protein